MNTRLSRFAIFLFLQFFVVAAPWAGDYVGQVKAEKILVTTTAGNGQKHAYLSLSSISRASVFTTALFL